MSSTINAINSASRPGINTPEVERPVRAGVFSTVASARKAIEMLKEGGFTSDELTVICSDETKERVFREYEHQDPAGANTPVAAATGGAVGATLFGLATAAI